MKNKISIIVVLLCGIFSITKAQKYETNWLIARWQLNQSELTSMNFDMYEFQKDSLFIFTPNSYNGLNRIIEIRGKYSIKGDSITFTPTYTKEVVGGYPVRSEVTTLSDTWEILEGKIRLLKCSRITHQKAFIRYNPQEKTILIGNQTYYKTE